MERSICNIPVFRQSNVLLLGLYLYQHSPIFHSHTRGPAPLSPTQATARVPPRSPHFPFSQPTAPIGIGTGTNPQTNITQPWIPPQPTQGSMEQQRRVSYTQHPAGVSSSSVPAYFSNPPASSHPRRPRNPFPGGKKVTWEPGQPIVANYLVMIFPYTVSCRFLRVVLG